MAPSMHPACTPSAACTPMRCHPTAPPCKNPEACLRKTRGKKKKCSSALSIMSARASGTCACSRSSRSRSGSKSNLKKKKGKGTRPARIDDQCCTGKGHRGRIGKKKCCRCSKCCKCSIL